MQLTGPVFLFLFLPLSFLILPFCPPRHRKLSIALLSFLWFLIAFRAKGEEMLQLLLVAAFVCLLSALPDRFPRLRCAIGVSVPLLALIAARLLAEYAPFPYTYPTGLSLLVLGAISIAIDRYRGDAPEREGPLGVLSYLFFFPTMLVGPILRYKQFLYVTDHISPDRDSFAYGAQLYMLGFIKRLAIAAVLLRAIDNMLSISGNTMPLLAFLLLLIMAYALLYSFISGSTDMARGLMAMYGMKPPRGQSGAVALLLPHRVLYSLLLSLDRYLEDYVVRPLQSLLPHKIASVCSTVLVFLLTVLFYRTRPEMLLLALPLLLCALLTAKRSHFRRFPKHPVPRVLCSALSILCLSVFSLGLILQNPLDILTLLRNSLSVQDSYAFFYLFGSVGDARYLVFCLLLAAVIPISHYYPVLMRHISARTGVLVQSLLTLFLCIGFAASLLYFLPQFPENAKAMCHTFCEVML